MSVIATKLGTPMMLDSYASSMCMDSWGKCSYARAMIEVRTDLALRTLWLWQFLCWRERG